MSRRVTILDVAKAAGVSKSTVSLVLRGSPSVRAETVTAVRAAMAEIGYVYNRSAATLRGASVGLIGLVINDLRNPFFTEFAAAVQGHFSAKGYATVIANAAEDPEEQARQIGTMIEHGVSAIILSPAYGDEAGLARLAAAGIPTLLVLRAMEEPEGFPFASFDYRDGGEQATAHLLAQGAKNIAFVGGIAGRGVTEERMSGYLSVLGKTGRDPFTLPGPTTRAFGRDAALTLATKHPEIDAALCFNDQIALGMSAGFAEAGRIVGRDFLLVGFDDIEDCALVWPRLSSVHCDIGAFGKSSAETIIAWLEHGTKPAPLTRAPVTLSTRASTLGDRS
ncbi:LacI family DNA-binding transcriptional regulator [Paracoccaceae bacterium GXU_MW_L88]